MSSVDIDHIRTWIGREQETIDVITPRLAESYNAIFNADLDNLNGDDAPTGIHWCLAPDIAPMRALGLDGHPARGGFLPPVPFPRRMWAGGQLWFSGSFRIGDEVAKRSVIEDVTQKIGRTGSLIFVTIRHDYRTARGPVLSERQDIVYREQALQPLAGAEAPSAPETLPAADRTDLIEATPTLLFRYSAVTFNGHRIHYDLDYVTKEEGYPGLVFHGPLQASYLLRLAVDAGGGTLPRDFSFRSVRPLFAGGQISVNSRLEDAGSLWIADQTGQRTMTATAIW
jgi:3-methylfumaryl-CoA hydratase